MCVGGESLFHVCMTDRGRGVGGAACVGGGQHLTLTLTLGAACVGAGQHRAGVSALQGLGCAGGAWTYIFQFFPDFTIYGNCVPSTASPILSLTIIL